MPKKITKEFRFSWHAKDAHTSFMGLTAEQIGVLMQIINLIYLKRDKIENDPKWISQSIHDMGSSKCRRIISELEKKGEIYITNDNKIGQNRAENEVNFVRNLRENQPKLARNSSENEGEIEQNQPHGKTQEIENRISSRIRVSISKILEELPDLNPDCLKAFFEFRNAIGKPIHQNFIPNIIEDLKKLKSQGEDLNQVLLQSPKNGWSSLQPIQKGKNLNGKSKSRKQDLTDQANRLLDKIAASEPRESDDSLL